MRSLLPHIHIGCAAALLLLSAHGIAQEAERTEAEGYHAELDTDGNGVIEPDELNWPGLFDRIDRDSDGGITLDEVRAFRRAQGPRRRQGRPPDRAPTDNPHFAPRELTSGDGETLKYWLMQPEAYDPAASYPLVLALHGAAGRAQAPEMLGRDEMRADYACFAMAPAAPGDSRWATPERVRPLMPRDEVLPLVFEAIEALMEEFSIDPARIYVTGQSMGGAGTYGALVMRPEFFAAAAPMCGNWDLRDAPAIAHVPIWLFHGDADPTVPVSASRDMVEALEAADGQPKYTEYEGVGHNCWTPAYDEPELWEWLFAQRRVEEEG